MKKQDGRIVIRDKMGQNTWRNEYYYPDQVENSFPRKFGDFELNCPASAEDYLEQNYGEDWAHVGSTQVLCHKTVGPRLAEEFTLDKNMFLPALPFY